MAAPRTDTPPVVVEAWEGQRQTLRAVQDRQVAAVLRRLAVVRERLLTALAATDPQRLTQAMDGLRRLLQELAVTFQRAVTGLVQDGQRLAVALGQALVDAPLLAAGVRLALPEVTVPLLETLLQFSADKVTGLSADLVARVTTELQLGVLGAQTPVETMARLQDLLKVDDAGRTDLATRVEAITRTETGRVHSTATQRRLEQARRTLPDLLKEWLHSGVARNPRSGHQAAHGQRVPVEAPFLVAPVVGARREALMYPRDPRASARNTVSCRCTHVPWLARWAEAAA